MILVSMRTPIHKKKSKLLSEAEEIMREAQTLLYEILSERGLSLNEITQEIVPLTKK